MMSELEKIANEIMSEMSESQPMPQQSPQANQTQVDQQQQQQQPQPADAQQNQALAQQQMQQQAQMEAQQQQEAERAQQHEQLDRQLLEGAAQEAIQEMSNEEIKDVLLTKAASEMMMIGSLANLIELATNPDYEDIYKEAATGCLDEMSRSEADFYRTLEKVANNLYVENPVNMENLFTLEGVQDAFEKLALLDELDTLEKVANEGDINSLQAIAQNEGAAIQNAQSVVEEAIDEAIKEVIKDEVKSELIREDHGDETYHAIGYDDETADGDEIDPEDEAENERVASFYGVAPHLAGVELLERTASHYDPFWEEYQLVKVANRAKGVRTLTENASKIKSNLAAAAANARTQGDLTKIKAGAWKDTLADELSQATGKAKGAYSSAVQSSQQAITNSTEAARKKALDIASSMSNGANNYSSKAKAQAKKISEAASEIPGKLGKGIGEGIGEGVSENVSKQVGKKLKPGLIAAGTGGVALGGVGGGAYAIAKRDLHKESSFWDMMELERTASASHYDPFWDMMERTASAGNDDFFDRIVLEKQANKAGQFFGRQLGRIKNVKQNKIDRAKILEEYDGKKAELLNVQGLTSTLDEAQKVENLKRAQQLNDQLIDLSTRGQELKRDVLIGQGVRYGVPGGLAAGGAIFGGKKLADARNNQEI